MYAMLDGPVEVSKGGRGQRKYTEGSIPGSGGVHRVVLALLPDMGNNSAAHRATLLLEHFPMVHTVLMVGIAGGAPNPAKPEDHVRLGDIVVSGHRGHSRDTCFVSWIWRHRDDTVRWCQRAEWICTYGGRQFRYHRS